MELDANSTTSNPETIELKPEPVADSCKAESFQIKTPADVDALDNCKTVEGDIVISGYKHPILLFRRLETIIGDFVVTKSPELVRIEAPLLASITNRMKLAELTSLSLISFPSLSSVKILSWKVLPILSNVHFSNEIKGVDSITVSDTSLTGFSGFVADKLETLDINNNRFLDNINSNVKAISGRWHIAANAREVYVKLPQLKAVHNMSIHEVLDIDLGLLEEVGASVSLVNNYFSNLKLPKLKTIGGTLSLLKNDRVQNLEFPSVSEIGGGLVVVNNTKIEKINFLPKLTVIGGALELVGNIKEASLKQLKLIKGSALVKSLVSFDCNSWSHSEIRSVTRGGKIECSNGNNQKFVASTPTDDVPGVDFKTSGATVTRASGLLLLLVSAFGVI